MDVSAQTYQVGAHFAAPIEGVLMAPLKTIERFSCISTSPAGLCALCGSEPDIFHDILEFQVHSSWIQPYFCSSVICEHFPEDKTQCGREIKVKKTFRRFF